MKSLHKYNSSDNFQIIFVNFTNFNRTAKNFAAIYFAEFVTNHNFDVVLMRCFSWILFTDVNSQQCWRPHRSEPLISMSFRRMPVRQQKLVERRFARYCALLHRCNFFYKFSQMSHYWTSRIVHAADKNVPAERNK